jgi:hypothetical protein
VDLAEAQAELAAAMRSTELMMTLDRVDDARSRLARWRESG